MLQGEREMAGRQPDASGRFHLTGIPPAPRGVPQIEVTFDIDANGILNVSAKDKATSKEQKVTITHSSGLAKDEVEKMVADARSHEAEDKARRELVEVKNRAENLQYQMEKLVKENKDKLSADSVKASRTAVQAAQRRFARATDKAAIESAIERARAGEPQGGRGDVQGRRRGARARRQPGAPGAEPGRGAGQPGHAEEGRRGGRGVPHQLAVDRSASSIPDGPGPPGPATVRLRALRCAPRTSGLAAFLDSGNRAR